tara:strand:- start:148 stop:465 length:318 start_codon:yes stop_codon:yes gene_type:complete
MAAIVQKRVDSAAITVKRGKRNMRKSIVEADGYAVSGCASEVTMFSPSPRGMNFVVTHCASPCWSTFPFGSSDASEYESKATFSQHPYQSKPVRGTPVHLSRPAS